MDVENKKQLIDICILSLIKREGCYGYYILKNMKEYTRGINEGTLYCILKNMENGGLISSYTQEYSGRLRRYYSLTEKGKEIVDNFVTKWAEIAEAYNFVLQDRNEKKRRWLS